VPEKAQRAADQPAGVNMTSRLRRFTLLAAVIALLTCALGTYLLWPERTVAAPHFDRLDASAERGHYLATIGNCQTCHTQRGGQAFAGGVRFQTPFGVLYSTNITADKEAGIGSWSFEDFYRSMKVGVRPDGTHLYPAFPYTSFAKLTDADIASIYLYVKTIAPVHSTPKGNELRFPFNLRVGLRAWNKLFHTPVVYVENAAQSAEWNRGAYLVQGVAHCGACHTPRNLLGAERGDEALSGGRFYDEVSRGKYREWFAVNLTPAKTGLAAWSAASIASYLRTGQCEHAVVHGPMNDVVTNSTRYLSDADVQAIARYLKEIPAVGDETTPKASQRQLVAGEIAYTVHCGTCHLPTGLGDEVLGVTLAGSAIVQAADPSSLINVVLHGPHLPPPPFVSDRTRMKAFGKRLSDEEIAALATYMRANFGNHASSVTAEQVNRQR
jgi:mono/diheme cytochrome c family protein